MPSSSYGTRPSCSTLTGFTYDYPFTTKVEGYRGLIVHGPLAVTLLLDAAKRKVGDTLTSFEYRGIAPLFNDESFTLAGAAVPLATTPNCGPPARPARSLCRVV